MPRLMCRSTLELTLIGTVLDDAIDIALGAVIGLAPYTCLNPEGPPVKEFIGEIRVLDANILRLFVL